MTSNMQSMASKFAQYKKPEVQTTGRKVERWQDYAAKIIKEFNIKKSTKKVWNEKKCIMEDKVMDWPGMIFRKAKNNIGFLESKVALTREKCAMENGKTENYGHYLISLFRKVKPWEK